MKNLGRIAAYKRGVDSSNYLEVKGKAFLGANLKSRNLARRLSALILCLFMGLALLALVWPETTAVAQTTNGISQPASGDIIADVVIIEGTASDPNFLRYELAFLQDFNPGAGWIVFAEGEGPVIGGTLAIWDTTIGLNANAPVFPDGSYQLRLRVVRADYNYNEYFVTGLIVSNGQPTPTPTVTITETIETMTPAVDSDPLFVTPVPPLLPSLTPFPTPSAQPTPVNEPQAAADGAEPTDGGERQGLSTQLLSMDTTRFGRAFRQGMTTTLFLFAALFLYLLLRNIMRRVWQFVLIRFYR